jgi:hypothetical protein
LSYYYLIHKKILTTLIYINVRIVRKLYPG